VFKERVSLGKNHHHHHPNELKVTFNKSRRFWLKKMIFIIIRR